MLDGESLRLLERLLKPLEDRLSKVEALLEDRLTQLESRVMRHDNRLEKLETASEGETTRRGRRSDRWRTRLELVFGGACVLAAGFGPSIVHWLF